VQASNHYWERTRVPRASRRDKGHRADSRGLQESVCLCLFVWSKAGMTTLMDHITCTPFNKPMEGHRDLPRNKENGGRTYAHTHTHKVRRATTKIKIKKRVSFVLHTPSTRPCCTIEQRRRATNERLTGIKGGLSVQCLSHC
jgi:hypothetical protein